MAIVSTKGAYGLTAIIILAKNKDKKLLQIKHIAKEGNIPSNYLEQILVILKRGGLVDSIRGANGGYRLIKDINDIKVYEVLRLLDCCVSFIDDKTKDSILEPFWEDVKEKMQKIFALTVKELIDFLEENSKPLVYHI